MTNIDDIVEHTLQCALEGALAAAYDALKKHGLPTSDPVRAAAILAEELGEVTEHALKLTSRDDRERCGQPQRDRLLLMRHELCQLAGYALLVIQNLDSGGFDRVIAKGN